MKQVYDMWIEREIGKSKEMLRNCKREVEKAYLEEYIKSLEKENDSKKI